jgi:hypothetical protein
LSRELTICAVESQTDYLPCLGSQYSRTNNNIRETLGILSYLAGNTPATYVATLITSYIGIT